ncbi:ABC transporter substrate-binding protein [Oceanobacillus sp. 1P07AA]|uniref:ABC transporter substrate-binding protein n=1 Tax=Oceanobacillus sp. 1P07AA TaxID=3132293 RepID=UPI0039A6ECF6
MRKILLIIVVVTVIFIAGCSGNESDAQSKAPEAFTVWAWDPYYNVKALGIAEEIHKEKVPDFELNIVENAQEDIVQKLNTSLSSGAQKGLPNIVLIEDYRAQTFLEAYPDAFYDLTGKFEANDFLSYKIQATSKDGKNYAIPFDTGSAGLYVRRDYLEEAGYTVEDLQNITWEEYIEIGKDVKEATGKNLITNDHNDLGIIRMMIQSSGEWLTEEDGVTPNIAGNESLKTSLELYKTFVDEGLLNLHSGWSQLLEAVNNDLVISQANGNWFTPSITAEESHSGNWAVVPFPRLPGIDESVNATNSGGSSFYVLNIPGKEQAADFLIHTFGSNIDLYSELVNEIGAIGTYIPANEAGIYGEEVEFFGGQTIYEDFSDWAEEIPGVNYGMHTYAISDMLAISLQQYLRGGDLDAILEEAQQQAERQLR